MSLCLQCGHPTSAGRDLCSHHDSCHADDWATGNKIMCDFLHRRIVSPSRAEFFIGRLEAAGVLAMQDRAPQPGPSRSS